MTSPEHRRSGGRRRRRPTSAAQSRRDAPTGGATMGEASDDRAPTRGAIPFSGRPPTRDLVRHSGEGGDSSRPSHAQQLRVLLRDATPTSSRQRHASPRHARPALARDEARPPSREISDHRMPPCEKEAPAFAPLRGPAHTIRQYRIDQIRKPGSDTTVVSRGHRHFTVDCGRQSQSGPRPKTGFLRQPALEGLTRSARTDSPRRVVRNKFRRLEAAAAAATRGGGGGGFVRGGRRRFKL
ncbi:hypothetical protein F511_37700 [Dorcoceras hygrometricum]|uniref:Uncharacterized protein n=1 Tax=Dorcoceras hygrometricum TaxID=472368 RepID=A0A2Z7CZP5_9LAMI|nr:hypothetical protein F511_37700 [Dorcoceras hygrometricum]